MMTIKRKIKINVNLYVLFPISIYYPSINNPFILTYN